MKTITYDETQWQLVPKKMTREMITEVMQWIGVEKTWERALATAPSPPLNTQDGVDELINAIRSINRAKHHEIRIDGDDEPCYWQRKEWIDWILELADAAEAQQRAKSAQQSSDQGSGEVDRIDAERYRWWKENIELLEHDNLAEVGFSHQLPRIVLEMSPSLLFQAIADAALTAKVKP